MRLEEGAIELYHRCSHALRVERDDSLASITCVRGTEDGVAARLWSPASGRVSFAACSGSPESGARRAVELCLAAARAEPGAVAESARRGSGLAVGVVAEDAQPWWSGSRGTLTDDDGFAEPPSEKELAVWLERARMEASEHGESGRRSSVELLDGWIEVATTVETWAADGGLRASRVRTRAWAGIRLKLGESLPRPLIVGSRRWLDLQPEAWRITMEDRWLVPADEAAGRAVPRGPVVFSPECSAALVRALVTTLHTGGGSETEVGPGWRVADDPSVPDALFGAAFDDSGFPTRRVVLAGGEKTEGVLEGPGHLRRPSFRDTPSPAPFHLVVEAREDTFPGAGILADGLVIHPLATGEWLLEIRGVHLDRDGVPVEPIGTVFSRVQPRALVRRCVAAVGQPRRSHLGVSTPALVFDDLASGPR
jgi:hypothetical protein